MYNHLTASQQLQLQQQQHHHHLHQHHQQQQQQQQQPQHDIYSILSTDMPDDAPIDTAELVKDIFDSSDFTTPSTATITNNNKSSPISSSQATATNSIVPTSTDFSFSHDLINFDLNQQYTPSSEVYNDPFLTLNNAYREAAATTTHGGGPPTGTYQRQADFARRHSVAVSGGIADLNNRLQSHSFPTTAYGVTPHLPMTRKAQTLPTVMEAAAPNHSQTLAPNHHRFNNSLSDSANSFNHLHRASMPNIFQNVENELQRQQQQSHLQQQQITSVSTRTTPNSTPPHIHIQFNSLPWSQQDDQQQSSNGSPNSNSTNNNSNNSNNNSNNNTSSSSTTHSVNLNPPSFTTNGPPVFQRRRFYSQCGLPTPPLHSQVQGLCPLPMSGVATRRASVATSNDIYTWNRNCANYKQTQQQQQQQQTSIQQQQQQVKEISNNDNNDNSDSNNHNSNNNNTPSLKRPRKSEETEDLQQLQHHHQQQQQQESDYPVITDADLEAAKKDANAIPRRQKLRFESDEYTPKWVRYTGQLKEGYCDTCQPGKWLQLKNSAYWYHKQFFHGISSVSGKPFEKPLEQRQGEQDVIEGLCHQCHTFVPICNSKRKNSVLWYRHAHKCHIYDKPKSKGGKRASISSRKYSETPQSIF